MRWSGSTTGTASALSVAHPFRIHRLRHVPHTVRTHAVVVSLVGRLMCWVLPCMQSLLERFRPVLCAWSSAWHRVVPAHCIVRCFSCYWSMCLHRLAGPGSLLRFDARSGERKQLERCDGRSHGLRAHASSLVCAFS